MYSFVTGYFYFDLVALAPLSGPNIQDVDIEQHIASPQDITKRAQSISSDKGITVMCGADG